MQDELNSRTMTLIIETGRLTGNVLQKAIRESLHLSKNLIGNAHANTVKKQSLSKLRAQGVTLNNVEITKDNIKSFDSVARKYKIEYALMKQNGSDPNGVAGAPKNATAGAAGIVFYGGYDEAERCMPVFLPDYATLPGYNVKAELEELLAVIRVSVPGRRAVQSSSSGRPGGRSLTHRDYLGSLLALGIRREMTGDILVRDGTSELGPGADIIVKAEIADFIISNYDKAGRTQLQTEVLPISQLHLEPVRLEHHRDTVASLRLDSVVSSAFRLSRAKAAEAIRRGLVSVNSIETMKIDASVSEGDKVVLRGQGKALLSEVGATTRKDRIRITIARYV